MTRNISILLAILLLSASCTSARVRLFGKPSARKVTTTFTPDTVKVVCEAVPDTVIIEIRESDDSTFGIIPVEENWDDEIVVELTEEELLEEQMAEVTILGQALADAETMYRFVSAHNPDFDREIAEAFLRQGEIYGIRGDIALCQSIVETGWFGFGGGTAVTPDQHNYCGLGVTQRGMKGHSFDTIDDGVAAQLQHLYAYACCEPLPEGVELLDPRFKLVKRGCAPKWVDLNNRWAANSRYGQQILDLYNRMINSANEQKQ